MRSAPCLSTFLLLAALLAACGGTSPQSANPAAPADATLAVAATVTSAGTPAVATPPAQPGANAAFAIQVLSPQDGAVVSAPLLDVFGLAPANTVLTINEQIILVGSDGQFKAVVTLDEGPNLIEIVASDFSGVEIVQLLTVTYQP